MMKANEQCVEIKKSEKKINSQGKFKDYTFHFIDGKEDMKVVLLKMITSRIEREYEI